MRYAIFANIYYLNNNLIYKRWAKKINQNLKIEIDQERRKKSAKDHTIVITEVEVEVEVSSIENKYDLFYILFRKEKISSATNQQIKFKIQLLTRLPNLSPNYILVSMAPNRKLNNSVS